MALNKYNEKLIKGDNSMKKNKILCAFLAALMVLSAAGCGNKESSSEKVKTTTTTSEALTANVGETTVAPEDKTDESENKDDTSKNDETVDINDYITVDNPSPALWKATDPKTGNELYLMGTIHVVSEEKYSLPDYVMDVYDNCDGVAVEVDPNKLSDMSVLQEFLTYLVYTDGTTIKDHISEESYEIGKECFEEMGMYNEVLDVYTAGFWLSQIESAAMLELKNISSEGVDARLAAMAADDGKEVIDIENLEIQASAMNAYSDAYADFCFKSIKEELDDPSAIAESLGDLYNLWASGKIDEMLEVDEETDDLPEELLDDYNEYMNTMLYKRNAGMAERASEFLKNGDNYFFMVGSLHFAGDRGVDDLLADMGYTVERVH